MLSFFPDKGIYSTISNIWKLLLWKTEMLPSVKILMKPLADTLVTPYPYFHFTLESSASSLLSPKTLGNTAARYQML